jgi:hypothetical protein
MNKTGSIHMIPSHREYGAQKGTRKSGWTCHTMKVQQEMHTLQWAIQLVAQIGNVWSIVSDWIYEMILTTDSM